MKNILQILAILMLLPPSVGTSETANSTNPYDPHAYILATELARAAQAQAKAIQLGFVDFHGREFASLTSTGGTILTPIPKQPTTRLLIEALAQSLCLNETTALQLKPARRLHDPSAWLAIIERERARLLYEINQRCRPEIEPTIAQAE